jgi:hypothetical protein
LFIIQISFLSFFFLCLLNPKRTYAVSLFEVLDHTQLDTHIHTCPVGLLRRSDRLVAQTVTYITQLTNIHALSRIRTCNLNNRALVTEVNLSSPSSL